MTAEEIMQLPAGPELDDLVSAHVFARHNAPDVPKFSQDIAAAWQVLDRLISGEFGREYVFPQVWRLVYDWRCDLGSSTGRWVIASGSTAPLAICRAALMAANPRRPI